MIEIRSAPASIHVTVEADDALLVEGEASPTYDVVDEECAAECVEGSVALQVPS